MLDFHYNSKFETSRWYITEAYKAYTGIEGKQPVSYEMVDGKYSKCVKFIFGDNSTITIPAHPDFNLNIHVALNDLVIVKLQKYDGETFYRVFAKMPTEIVEFESLKKQIDEYFESKKKYIQMLEARGVKVGIFERLRLY